MTLTLSRLNELNGAEFVSIVGPVFEHSPWIAEMTWLKRPFASLEELHGVMCKTVRGAGREKQLALIRAQPDLVGRAALDGTLTRKTSTEHAVAGLNKLSPGEI